MSKELKEAIVLLGKEKNISKESLFEAIENSLLSACKNHFGTSDNCRVLIDPDTCDYKVVQIKEVVENYEEDTTLEKSTKIPVAQAKLIDPAYNVGDMIQFPVESKEFGRIATGVAKNVILQKIREEERKVIYRDYFAKEKDIVTGIISRQIGKNFAINLGKCDAILTENEQVKSENLKIGDRVKVYVLEVKDAPKGPKITASRTHPDLVKKLFEAEVSEIGDGTVEIMSIAREAGSRTKIAVASYDENVDPVGSCVGLNGSRVNAVVDELHGEKIDIINWDENPAYLIENALSPAKVICVVADEEGREATVIVPDYQLSLAIGKEGQNARLAAKLTGFKIDIKSESQARETGLFDELGIDYQSEGVLDLEATEYIPENDENYVAQDENYEAPENAEAQADGTESAPEEN